MHPYPVAQPTPYAYPPRHGSIGAPAYNPNAPRPIEVYHLNDAANAAIPPSIRSQFHCNDHGQVLFFSTPPLDMIKPTRPNLTHSLKYLASKEDRQKKVAEHKRKRDAAAQQLSSAAKRQRADEETALASRIEALAPKAITAMVREIASGTDQLYNLLYEEKADSARAADIETRDSRMNVDRENHYHTAEIQARSANTGFVNLKGDAMYLGQDQDQNQNQGQGRGE